ncbi:MAG: HD domain-containing protein, partial [Candidatus Woesearchaeota archaeon]
MKVKRMGSKIHAKTQATTQTDRCIVESSKKYFYEWLKRYPDGPYDYEFHVPQVVRWAKFILKGRQDIDAETVLASAWLHDIGSYPLSKKDHAVVGERVAKRFLKTQGHNPEKTKKILHCIRA